MAQAGVRRIDRAGDEHDRDRRPLRSTLGDELVAALAAEVDVEHDDVDLVLVEHRARGGERVSLDDLVAFELEIHPAQKPDRRLVVDDQDPDRRRMPPGIAHRASLTSAAIVRTQRPRAPVYSFEVAEDTPQPARGGRGVQNADVAGLPLPTQRFRRRAWLLFERALDPLGPPKPLPPAAIRPPPREDG